MWVLHITSLGPDSRTLKLSSGRSWSLHGTAGKGAQGLGRAGPGSFCCPFFPVLEPPAAAAVAQLVKLSCLCPVSSPGAPGGKAKPPVSLGKIPALQMLIPWG